MSVEPPQPAGPPSDPWRADAVTAAYAGPAGTMYLPAEELASHGSATLMPVPAKRRRRGFFIAGGLVLALLAGMLAYAGVAAWYGWSTTEPESVLPGTVAAFARVDFSPGLGQQLRIANLAKKFPQPASTPDTIEQLRRDLVDELGLSPLNYDADIRSWFGDRLGAGNWTAPGAGTCSLVAVASKDDNAARTALTKVQRRRGPKSFGFAFSQGYAVYSACHGTDSQAAVQTALTQAASQTLADRPAFADALSTLPAGQTAVAWAELSEVLGLGLEVLELQPSLARITGDVVVGLQATGDGLDLRYRVHSGTHAAAPARDAVADLGALPGGTVIGLAADFGNLGSDPTTGLLPSGSTDPKSAAGLSGLFRSAFSLSVTDVASSPALRLVTRSAGADAAAAIEAALRGPFALDALPGGRVDRTGNTVTLTAGNFHPGPGTLADSAVFRTAMGSAAGGALLAAYVDVQSFAAAQHLKPTGAAQLAPVKAIGFSTGYDGDTLAGLLRVVIQ